MCLPIATTTVLRLSAHRWSTTAGRQRIEGWYLPLSCRIRLQISYQPYKRQEVPLLHHFGCVCGGRNARR